MTDEKKLVERAQRGDRGALNDLVSLYWEPVYRMVLYKIGEPHDAQEIVQETFLRAFRSLSGYKDMNATFKTYLGRIALNLINDRWRKLGRTPVFIDIAEYQEPLADNSDRPEDHVIAVERRQEIERLIEELPPEQSKVITLRIIEGLSVQEAAQRMDKTEAAVKMLQQRALSNLRKIFKRNGIQ